MKHLLAFLISIAWVNLFAQKITGVYVGKITSARNALVLEMSKKEGRVYGTLYVTRQKHFDFVGTYDKPLLKGVIDFDSVKVKVEGNLKGNFLTTEFPDSLGKKPRLLYKASSDEDLDMQDLFSETHDMLLLGKWTSFKKLDIKGNDITEPVTMTHEFQTRGRGTNRLGNIAAISSYTNGSISAGDLHPDHFKFDIDWETHSSELKITAHVMNIQAPQFNTYFIRNDTLVTTNSVNGKIVFYKRK